MKTKAGQRLLEWSKTLLILLLSASALLLISQSNLYDDVAGWLGNQLEPSQSEESDLFVGTGERSISVKPARILVQNQSGRYGVRYDREAVDLLFESRLGGLLREAVTVAETAQPVEEAQMRAVITGEGSWAYYDFLSQMPIAGMSVWLGNVEEEAVALSGTVRRFLLAEEADGQVLYYKNEEDGQYYRCNLPESEGITLEAAISDLKPNGTVFAFEAGEEYAALGDYVMIMDSLPELSVYEVQNPLEGLSDAQRDELLQTLRFNPKAVSVYQGANGQAIREGGDTLRLFQNGTLSYHSTDTAQTRYQTQDTNATALVEEAQDLLADVLSNQTGEGRIYLIGVETQEDGSQSVTFGYSLDGAPVQVYGQGFAAQFIFRNGYITDFTIHVRCYITTERKAAILPERLAAAGMESQGQEKKELLLSYMDLGSSSEVTVAWTVQ